MLNKLLYKMSKQRIIYLLDFIPLILMLIFGINLVWILSTTKATFTWMNIVALIIFFINISLFFWDHKIGVLVLGLLLILGLFSLLSFTPGITRSTMTFGKTGIDSTITLSFQPEFILWLLIHFILSGRFYIGILSKKILAQFFCH